MYIPNDIEKSVLNFWDKNEIFSKLVEKLQFQKRWFLLDGPITANNPMGVHHAWGRTLKDLYQRYKAMQGFQQRFQNGFDCQGLWVEVEVEKDLGLNSKKEIEDYGIEKFSLKCRERVVKYSKMQISQSKRLGQWNDWENSYYTMSDSNIEHIWLFLRKCYDNKWLYSGSSVLPWCYRCGTSLSQHELYDSYKDLSHISVFLRFPIKDKQNEYLLVWTTTPWTLTSNVALAVNPGLNYVKVKHGNHILYLSDGTLSSLQGDYVVIERFKGRKLVGIRYNGPFNEVEAQKNIDHKVVAWEIVSEQEGTGIVHIAPGCGAEDNALGKKENLIEISPLDESGNYIEGFGWLTGKNVEKVTQEIIDYLDKNNFLHRTLDYRHRYPTCWRCGTELVFRLVNEWFISVKEIRPLMIKANKKINWNPSHVSKLMEDWLKNMGDWVISRKRYWGLPLPIWKCVNNHVYVMATKKELLQRAISGIENLKELHRPWIDNVKIKCGECQADMSRIKDVGDAWLDAGIVPFSTLGYLDSHEDWKKWYPANLVCEMREQVRLWFYSMLFMSVALENKVPYKNVLSHEKVYDEIGRPMHKSWGNAIWFDDAVEKMGADVMRWMYCRQDPKFNLNFGYKMATQTKQTLGMLFNLAVYMDIVGKEHGFEFTGKEVFELEDQWIGMKLNTLTKDVTNDLEDLNPNLASKKLEDFFVNTFSRTYIQYIRERVQVKDGKNSNGALNTIYITNLTILKMLSPFIPFLTEHLYQKYFRKYEKIESIHLTNWPRYKSSMLDNGLGKVFEIAEEIIRSASIARDRSKIGMRWPLKEALIVSESPDVKKSLECLRELILRQTNIKSIKIAEDCPDYDFVDFAYGKFYLNTDIDEKLEREGYSRELIRRIQSLRKKAGLKKENKIELVINTNFNLKEHVNEIKLVVGAESLEFEVKNSNYEFKSIERIKDKEFEILFKVL